MKDLVSIIVPLYNKENYIKKCIQSIVNQDYDNFELIIINDGSTDKSIEICKEFVSEKIIIKEISNHGVHYARNLGISMAKGQYLCFVDADDFVEKTYISDMLNKIKDSNSDISICEYNKISNSNVQINVNYDLIEPIKDDIDIVYNNWLVLVKYFISLSSTAIYKKSIIDENNISFDDAFFVGEDIDFLCKYLMRCEKISFTKKKLYNYCENSVDFRYSSRRKYVNDLVPDKYYFSVIKLIEYIYDSSPCHDKSKYVNILMETIIKFCFEFIATCDVNKDFGINNKEAVAECKSRFNILMNQYKEINLKKLSNKSNLEYIYIRIDNHNLRSIALLLFNIIKRKK